MNRSTLRSSYSYIAYISGSTHQTTYLLGALASLEAQPGVLARSPVTPRNQRCPPAMPMPRVFFASASASWLCLAAAAARLQRQRGSEDSASARLPVLSMHTQLDG